MELNIMSSGRLQVIGHSHTLIPRADLKWPQKREVAKFVNL